VLEWQSPVNGDRMNKGDEQSAEMRDEYDFSGGVRGRYADRYAQGTNVVVLDPDVAEAFPTPKAVNDALRAQIPRREPAPGGGR
jgi:hypothetical protein